MIFVVKYPVGGKIPRYFRVAQILPDHPFVHRQIQFVGGLQKGGKIFPAAGGYKLGAVHVVFDLVKMLGAQFQVGQRQGAGDGRRHSFATH